MEKSGYYLLKDCPLRMVVGWCTVDIILLNIVLLGKYAWLVHSGYHPRKHLSS